VESTLGLRSIISGKVFTPHEGMNMAEKARCRICFKDKLGTNKKGFRRQYLSSGIFLYQNVRKRK
jgi:hypothetical protein